MGKGREEWDEKKTTEEEKGEDMSNSDSVVIKKQTLFVFIGSFHFLVHLHDFYDSQGATFEQSLCSSCPEWCNFNSLTEVLDC